MISTRQQRIEILKGKLQQCRENLRLAEAVTSFAEREVSRIKEQMKLGVLNMQDLLDTWKSQIEVNQRRMVEQSREITDLEDEIASLEQQIN